jgi:hypothetical protein
MTCRQHQPLRERVDKEGVVASGVFDQGTPDEDGPVTGEALASPRGVADGGRESEGGIGAKTSGNSLASWSRPSKGGPCWCEREEGTMTAAQTSEAMSPGLVKVVERAKQDPESRFPSLAQLSDVPALKRAYRRQRSEAAVGGEGVTKEAYGRNLEANLEDLHTRLKAKRYRPQPIRRVHIPNAPGKTRPLGLAAFEDKVVQDAVREVLEALDEQDLLDGSYGFRPGRNAPGAVWSLKRIVERGEGRWIVEADIMSFFDSLDRTKLKAMLGIRVADGSLMRLIGTGLHVGVLDGEVMVEELGTAQGSEAVAKIEAPPIEGLAHQRSWGHITRISTLRFGRTNHERQFSLSNRFDRCAMGFPPALAA